MSSDTDRKPATGPSLKHIIPELARRIALLDPGPAAALRRGPLNGAGAAAFWKLLERYSPDGAERAEPRWAALIQAIAILTPKGRIAGKESAHQGAPSMGEALHGAGVSELRLARLLAAPPDQRSELVIRTCRRLARTDFKRFNLIALGQFVLSNDSTRAARRIARDYYRADLAAKRKAKDKETTTNA